MPARKRKQLALDEPTMRPADTASKQPRSPVRSVRQGSHDPLGVRGYLARDWQGARDAKRQYWQARLSRLGLAEALRVTEQLRAWTARNNPSWPTEQQRAEDLETHQRVAQALHATAAPRQTPRSSAKPPPELALVAFASLAKRLGIRWYVFGAQAVNLYGFPRATADLDLTIELGTRKPSVIVSELRRASLDHAHIDELLRLLEEALDQSDLRRLYRRLRDER